MKVIRIILFILIHISLFDYCYSHESGAEQLIQINRRIQSADGSCVDFISKGKIYLDFGDIYMAKNNFMIAYKNLHCKDSAIWLARSSFLVEEYAESIRYLSEIIKNGNVSPNLLELLALNELRLGNYEKAENIYNELIAGHGEAVTIDVHLSRFDAISNVVPFPNLRFREAANIAIKDKGKLVSIYEKIIKICNEKNELEEAIYWLDIMPSVYSSQPNWLVVRASVLIKLGRSIEAKNQCDELEREVGAYPIHKKSLAIYDTLIHRCNLIVKSSNVIDNNSQR